MSKVAEVLRASAAEIEREQETNAVEKVQLEVTAASVQIESLQVLLGRPAESPQEQGVKSSVVIETPEKRSRSPALR